MTEGGISSGSVASNAAAMDLPALKTVSLLRQAVESNQEAASVRLKPDGVFIVGF